MRINPHFTTVGEMANWSNFEKILLQFLESDHDFLLVGQTREVKSVYNELRDESAISLDLVQFLTLRICIRGELGIYELRWYLSKYATSLPFFQNFLSFKFIHRIFMVNKVLNRLQKMQVRRIALEALVGEVLSKGLIIPNYIEPNFSTVLISRDFCKALLDLNSSEILTPERAIFALARSAAFKCVRIANLV